VLGQCPGATDGFDAGWDLPLPPFSPGEIAAPQVWLFRPDWGLSTGDRFRSDLRGTADRPQPWVAVLTRSEPGPVSLQWTDEDLPSGLDLEIYLPSEDRLLAGSLHGRPGGQQGVKLEVGAAPVTLQFRVAGSAGEGPAPVAGLNLRNVPNPFNAGTDFRFNLPREGEAAVRIYNLRGAVVRMLPGGRLAAGPGRIHWNGRDRHGAQVASGAYFYRLYLDGEQEGPTRKMVLLK